MNILRYIAKSIPGIVIFLIVIELVWSNTLVSSGRVVGETDAKIAQLRYENEQLEQQVASASSLLTIAAKAQEAGFVSPTKNQFVMIGTQDLPVALNR